VREIAANPQHIGQVRRRGSSGAGPRPRGSSPSVDKLAKVTQGTVVIPCGGGKTRVGMGAIARLRTPALILVHTLDLAEQWLGELRDKLDVAAGLIGDGEECPAPVTVAVIQALVRWEPAKLDAFLGGFGLLILDEPHHVAASTFRSSSTGVPRATASASRQRPSARTD
jgi:superfamily II DNA or RNA helicase